MIQGTSLRQFAIQPILALSALVAVITLSLMTATVARAQPFTILYGFCSQPYCTDGQSPNSLIQATNGDFYGTTRIGGTGGFTKCETNCGTVFRITPSGTLTTLYSFCSRPECADGALPESLIQARNGDFYGATTGGGANSGGTVFKVTPSGELTTLYSFCSQFNCADGSSPLGALIQATNGDFYGTTSQGGTYGGGTAFKITPSGALTTLHSFCSLPNCADGAFPNAALIQATDGDLYGTTDNGGTFDYAGTIFKITPSGTLTTLYSFCSIDSPSCLDGYKPNALIQAANGDFYGTTGAGGASLGGNGTVFKITPGGTLVTLFSFCTGGDYPNCLDGYTPDALIQATNGDFYGTTAGGGIVDYAGTVFKITPAGELATLFNFCSRQTCAETSSYSPFGGFVEATNGDLYGTTSSGGGGCYGGICFNGGTVFKLNVGLGPCLVLQNTSGEVGTNVEILGTNLSAATSVTFNGTPATYSVNSIGTAISAVQTDR
jgi:uncharacterized repeat protein (TIGR03803 family)